MGQLSHSKSHSKAKELLGEVNGEELLQKVTADVMTFADRRDVLSRRIAEEDEKNARLARVLRDDILGRIRGKNAAHEISLLDEISLQRTLHAVVRIQSFVRGVLSRMRTKVARTEHRVVMALGVLISELSLPDMKKKTHLSTEKSKGDANQSYILNKLQKALAQRNGN